MTAALLLAGGSGASAQQANSGFSAPAGSLSVWGQGVLTTNGRDDGLSCDNGGTEFCADVLGYGASANLHLPLAAGWSVITDGLFDYHDETNSISSRRNDDALYYSFGLHLVNDEGAAPWGLFALIASGENHANESDLGTLLGVGFEIQLSAFFIQSGLLTYVGSDVISDDTLDNVYFIRGGTRLRLADGLLTTSAAVGIGDSDQTVFEYNPGSWVQFAAQYERPITQNINWFIGYQGDYVWVRDSNETEEVVFHAIKAGLKIPFGNYEVPFDTPNFRAPAVNAGEMN